MFIDQILNKLKCAFKKFVETNETKLITSSVQQIKKIIDYGLTSVKCETREIEKRNILIVKGVYISLNYILTTLEEKLKNSVEVWLTASENLFIDYKRIIDVSRLNGQPENKPSKAENGKQYGTESDKNGKHGQNGMKGESGGNITIICETVENGHNLEIKTNGGNGSYGQDGGDGVDGEKGADGHGLDMGEFKRTFPPAAAFGATQSMENVKKIIAYLEENATIIKSKKWGNTLGRHGLACYYIEAETAQGNLISFSYYWGIFTKQAYCFYRGTSGEPGTPGGFGGLGGYAGEPGLAGDIKILTKPDVKANIKTSAIDGSRSSDGQKGRDGNFGKSGENKPDVGYIDCQTWKEPVYYGPNWYKLSIYASSDTYRIRSSEYESITEYVQIELRSAPEPPACLSINEAEKHRHNNTKTRKQEATRKHAISNELLTQIYNDHQRQFATSSVESLQVNVNLFREQISCIQSEETQIQIENICITKSLIDEKHYKLNKLSTKKVKLKNKSSLLSSSNSLNIIEELLEKLKIYYKDKSEVLQTHMIILEMNEILKSNRYNFEDMLKISLSIEKIFNESKLDNLKSLFKDPKIDNEFDNLKSFVIEKLKLLFLKNIVAKYIDDNENYDRKIIDEFIEEETHRGGGDSAIHAVLGIKNEFGIYENINCEKIRKEIQKNFIKIVKTNDDLSKSIHRSMLNLIKKSREKTKYPEIKKYVDNFKKVLNSTTIKDNCSCKDENVLIEYRNYICQNSQSFHVNDIGLLAYHGNICLNVHVPSANDKDEILLNLCVTYNKNSTNIEHVCYIDNRFIKLSTRKIENKDAKCAHYKQILNDIEKIKTTEELVKYCDEKCYARFRENENEIFQENNYDDEKQIIDEICNYFYDEKTRDNVRLELTMIASELIENFQIIKRLKKRFDIENFQIKDEIITLLSMEILNS
ncbi:unnamed protein product, partial [Didymodactylos carnosus]